MAKRGKIVVLLMLGALSSQTMLSMQPQNIVFRKDTSNMYKPYDTNTNTTVYFTTLNKNTTYYAENDPAIEFFFDLKSNQWSLRPKSQNVQQPSLFYSTFDQPSTYSPQPIYREQPSAPQQTPTSSRRSSVSSESPNIHQQEFNITVNSQQATAQNQTDQAKKALEQDLENLKKDYAKFTKIIEVVKNTHDNLSEEELSIKIQEALWTNRKNITLETYLYHLYTKIMEDEESKLRDNPDNFVRFMTYLTINGGLPTIADNEIDGALTFVKNTSKGKELSYWQMAQFMVPTVVSAAVSGAGKGLAGGVALATAAAAADKASGFSVASWLPAAGGFGTIGAVGGLFSGAVQGYNQVKQLSSDIAEKNKTQQPVATRRKESTWNWVMRKIGIQRTRKNRF